MLSCSAAKPSFYAQLMHAVCASMDDYHKGVPRVGQNALTCFLRHDQHSIDCVCT